MINELEKQVTGLGGAQGQSWMGGMRVGVGGAGCSERERERRIQRGPGEH